MNTSKFFCSRPLLLSSVFAANSFVNVCVAVHLYFQRIFLSMLV